MAAQSREHAWIGSIGSPKDVTSTPGVSIVTHPTSPSFGAVSPHPSQVTTSTRAVPQSVLAVRVLVAIVAPFALFDRIGGPMISADIAGLNRVRGTLLAASAAIATQAGQHVRNTALDVEATAKTLAPVRTGNLRRSITHQVNNVPGGVEATIGTNVEYAHFLEHGTSRMAPRAFMGPALDRHSGDFVDGLARLGSNIL